MQTTKAPPDPNHPMEIAKREAKRGHPAELAAMRDQIARVFGLRIRTDWLEPEESGELLGLHKKCRQHEGYEAGTATTYGLASKLTDAEQARWRRLVGKAAGDERLLDRLDEDVTTVRRIRELLASALTPAPVRTAAPPGSAVLPAAAWRDVIEGRLLPIDLAVLAAVLFAFQGGGLPAKTKKRQDALWDPDGRLVLRDGLHRLLPQWSKDSPYGDAVGADRANIETRLAESAWLEVDRHSPREITVRLGERLTGAVGEEGAR